MPALLVHILAYRRPALLRRCCESVARSLPPDARVLVWFNGPQPESENLFRDWTDERFEFRWEAERPRAAARSLVLREGGAEFVYFLDDDVIVEPGIFERAVATMRAHPELAVLGGPNLTPPKSSLRQRLTASVLANPFTAPGVWRRYRRENQKVRDADERSLILCNLLVRTASVPSGIEFEEAMRGNEENLWLSRLATYGARFGYRGDLVVYHERRPSLRGFAAQLFGYGYGRAQQCLRAPSSTRLLFLVPAAVLASLPLVVLVDAPALLLAILVVYGALTTCGFLTGRRAESLPWGAFILFPFVAAIGHVAYGIGFWRGLLGELGGRRSLAHVRELTGWERAGCLNEPVR